MNFFEPILAGFGTGAGLIVAIGAQNAFVLRQGLKRSHVPLIVATCIFGDCVCISAGVAGMGEAVERLPVLLEVFRWGGAAFLLWYGLLAIQRAVRGGASLAAEDDAPVKESAAAVLAACLAFTFLNPHVYLDTVVFLGSISTRYEGSARWLFAAGAMSASFVWFNLLGFGAALLRPLFRKPAAWRVLDAAIALVMLSIALLLALNPLR